MRAQGKPRKTKIASLAQIIFLTALLSFLVLPKAKPGVRTEALFSIWRQTEGTFKGWLGDGKTAHSRTQSGLFLTSWGSMKMNGEVRAGRGEWSQEVSPCPGETSLTGWAAPKQRLSKAVLQRGLPGEAEAASLPSGTLGEEMPPVGTSAPQASQTQDHMELETC